MMIFASVAVLAMVASAEPAPAPPAEPEFHAALKNYLAAEKKKGVELAPVYNTCEFMQGGEQELCQENVFVQLLKKRLAAQGEELHKLYETDPDKAPFERLTKAGRSFARKMMSGEQAKLEHKGVVRPPSIDQLMKEYPAIQECLDAVKAAKGPSGPLMAKRALTMVVARCGADDKACRDANVEKWSAANCPKEK
ncbi:MAG: hypothetical protein NTY77_08800 [Elusimicrobia bacterium]|nr:hypothetical protein [Elusimicrobiota bacterium]